jgi:hypothetical protein
MNPKNLQWQKLFIFSNPVAPYFYLNFWSLGTLLLDGINVGSDWDLSGILYTPGPTCQPLLRLPLACSPWVSSHRHSRCTSSPSLPLALIPRSMAPAPSSFSSSRKGEQSFGLLTAIRATTRAPVFGHLVASPSQRSPQEGVCGSLGFILPHLITDYPTSTPYCNFPSPSVHSAVSRPRHQFGCRW